MKQVYYWAPVAFGLVFLGFLAYLQRDRTLKAQNDFVQFYTASKLVGTPELYSRTANLATVQAIHGFVMDSVVYTRPPFYAALLKPLAFFPYRTAYAIFSLASFLSVLWFVIQFSKECPALPFFAAFSIPMLSAFCGGQDTPFLLVFLGCSILLTRRGKDFAAGLVLSLCAIKFHLFLFLPILLLFKKRWRILGGVASGTLLLTTLGILVAGVDSISQYVKVLRDPWINPSATIMPNLHGLVAVLHGSTALEFALGGCVLAAFVWMASKSDSYEFLLAVSLIAGLLVSFHSGVADDLVLFAVFVLVLASSQDEPLRAMTALILTPIPYFMVLADAPYSAALPILLLLLIGMAGVSLLKKPAQVSPANRIGELQAAND